MDEAYTGAGEAVSRVREIAGDAGDKAGRAIGRVTDSAKKGVASVREQPMVLAGIGLAFGAALAALAG